MHLKQWKSLPRTIKYFISFGVLLEKPAFYRQFIECTYFHVILPTCMPIEINQKARMLNISLPLLRLFYIEHTCALCIIDTYTIFDGLTHNTRGYFASCEIFFRASDGATKNTSDEQNIRSHFMFNHRIRFTYRTCVGKSGVFDSFSFT